MTEFITMGAVLGLSAGFAPGPLLTLVISETLRHDIRSGIKVALSPLITDLPIIILTVFVLSELAHSNSILGVISLIGGCVVFYMGYESTNPKTKEAGISDEAPKSLLKGVLANALSPHPYLFWLSVGAPMIGKAMKSSTASPFLFIGCFYIFLVGSKIGLAVLVGRWKFFLTGRLYLCTMRLLGGALCLLALFLLRDGLKLLEIMH
jgi:threonine/homoserine/homoserine lactone efflux protein